MKKKCLVIMMFIIVSALIFIKYIALRDTYAFDSLVINDEQKEQIVSGKMKLTYEIFGAKGDGKTNDFYAIKQTHDWANNLYINEGKMITVYGTKDKTYYLGVFDKAIDVITSTDWNGANFIVDDFIDNNGDGESDVGVYNPIFNITSPMVVKTNKKYLEFKKTDIESDLKIDNTTTNLSSVISAIKKHSDYVNNSFIRKQFFQAKYLVVSVTNSNKQYIRTGVNENSGSNQNELILIDSVTGEVLSDITWEYNDITSVVVYPISSTTINISNGMFETLTNNNAYTEKNGSPNARGWIKRNIFINYTGNVVLSNIKHTLNEKIYTNDYEWQSNPFGNKYDGFIQIDNTAFIKMKDIYLTPHTYVKLVKNGGYNGSIGTYDIRMDNSINIYLDNVSYYCDSSISNSECYKRNMLVYDEPDGDEDDLGDKWGVMGTNRLKNVFIINSELNVIDSHQGIRNLYIKDTIIGNSGFSVVGNGYLYTKNIIVDGPSWMINLASEYGSSWDGDIVMDEVKYVVGGREDPEVFRVSNTQNHDYGYLAYFPNIYIKNMEVDTSQNSNFINLNFIRIANKDSGTNITPEMRYYLRENIYVQNFSISNNGKVNFTNRNNSMSSSFYGEGNKVNLYLDSDIIVPNLPSDSKFKIVTSMSYDFDAVAIYFDELMEKFDIFNQLSEYKFLFEKDINIDKKFNYINQINIDTTISNLIDKISISGGNIEVKDKNNIRKTYDKKMATGDKLILSSNGVEKDIYTISVLGDVNGDENLDLSDVMKTAKHIYNDQNTLEGVYLVSADYDCNDNYNLQDIMKMAKAVYGGQ